MKRLIVLALALFVLAMAPRFIDKVDLPNIPVPPTLTTKVENGECPSQFLGGKRPEMPARSNVKTRLLCSTSYAALHSGITRTPLWSAELLTKDSVAAAKRVERVSEFAEDDRLDPQERAELDDYRRSGWDRGHLAPSADMPGLKEQQESFLLSNIVPQSAELNRGAWADLESDVRKAATRYGTAYVVTGALFVGQEISTTPNGRILVPTSLWKAIAIPAQGAVVMVAENNVSGKWRALSLSAFVSETGIDPFPGMAATSRQRLLNLR